MQQVDTDHVISFNGHEQEDLYRKIIDDARDAFSIIVGSTRVYANQALAIIYGVENPETLIGENAFSHIVEEDRGDVEKRTLLRQRQNTYSRINRYRIMRGDGEVRIVETSSSVTSYGGHPAVLCYTRDITEQQLIENSLQESEKKHRSLVEGAPLSILTADMKGFINSVNKRFTEFTGYSKEELIGKHFTQLGGLNNEDLPKLKSVFKLIQKGILPPSTTCRYQNKKGESRWSTLYFSFIEKDGANVGIQVIFDDKTAEKELERQLKESEELYQTIIRESPNAISITVDNTIVFANKKRAELSGYEDEKDIIGKSTHLFLYEDDIGKIDEIVLKREQGKEIAERQEFRMKRLDGSIMHIEALYSPIHFDGRDAGLHILNDITERKNAEENLKQSVERYRTLFQTSPIGILIVDLEGNVIDINPELTRILGWTKDDMTNIKLNELIPDDPEGLQKAQEAISTLISGGKAEPFQVRTQNKIGGWHWVEIHASPLIQHGKDLFIQALLKDVTGQRTLEKEAIDYRKKLEALNHNTVNLASATSIEEVAKHTIETVTKVLGFDIASFAVIEDDALRYLIRIGAENHHLNMPLSGPGITVRSVETKTTQKIGDVTKDPDYFLPEDMKNIRLSELCVPIIMDDAVLGILNIESEKRDAFSHDDQNLVEIVAQHAASALSRLEQYRKVEEIRQARTRELLLGADKMTSMVRHDLIGPLKNIKNSVYLSRRNSGENEKYIDIIDSNVDYAHGILEDLSHKTRSGIPNKGMINIRKLISQALNEFPVPENIHLTISQKHTTETMMLDETKIRRVIDNLVRNAIQSMPNGGYLNVRTYEENGAIMVDVSDSGKGIDPDKLDIIFQPFYTTKPAGMGLGLTYCKEAVESHNGAINVKSKINQGTTFTISLSIE